MGRMKKAQVGKKIDPKVYLEESRKRVKTVVDSARKQEVKKGIKTYDDYLKSKIKKQRSGGKIKPKASNVSKKLGSAKKSVGNMRFTKKKK